MTREEGKRLHEAIDRGVKKGVAEALRRHKERGQSIYIWQDGKVVEIPPEEIPVSPRPQS